MKKIISIAAVLCCGALATGCAQSIQAAAPAEPAAARQGLELYQQAALSIFGTRDQRLAAEKAAADKYQNAIAACMSATDAPYYTKAASPHQAGAPTAPGDLSTLAETGNGTFYIAEASRYGAQQLDRGDPLYDKLTQAQRDAQGKALSGCISKVPVVQPARPAGAQQMTTELETMFTAIEKQPAVASALKSYSDCMSDKAGIKTTGYLDTFLAVQEKFPTTSEGWSKLQNNPDWQAAAAFETKAAEADTTCRKPAQDQAMQAAAPQLQQFTSKYESQLDAASASWAKVAG
ncbi:hypothetical protein [Actinoplanes sp. NPDC051859]|uniref:hypothetical protein n=1 Tax=Actinoplanes sp. NPDC051859 TaxID=3363909 RepID=UPI0037A80DCC